MRVLDALSAEVRVTSPPPPRTPCVESSGTGSRRRSAPAGTSASRALPASSVTANRVPGGKSVRQCAAVRNTSVDTHRAGAPGDRRLGTGPVDVEAHHADVRVALEVGHALVDGERGNGAAQRDGQRGRESCEDPHWILHFSRGWSAATLRAGDIHELYAPQAEHQEHRQPPPVRAGGVGRGRLAQRLDHAGRPSSKRARVRLERVGPAAEGPSAGRRARTSPRTGAGSR